ncbi:MAG: DUF4339 domain-containing protein [Symploca sp. SIO2E9]|nr:DUF4339 domain-containing protein [Symploca sp. SIO2E9]
MLLALRANRSLGIMPLKLSETFIEWDQECCDLLFVPVAGDAVGKGEEMSKLPFGLLCVTRLKRNNSLTGSLDAFETNCSRISVTGRHPATWIWWSHFERKTGNIPDEKTGELKPATWHRLHWELEEIETERQYKMLVQIGERVQKDPELKQLPNTAPGKVQQAVLAAASEPEATIDPFAEWYLPNNDQPMTLEQIAEICNPDTIVKRQGMENWTKAENIPELALAMGLEEEF